MNKTSELLRAVFRRQWVRRSFVFLWLLCGIVACYLLAFAFRYDGIVPDFEYPNITKTLPVAAGVFLAVSIIFGLYKGIWTLFSFGDCIRHASFVLLGGIFFGGCVFLVNNNSFIGYPRSVLFLYPLLLVGWEFLGRSCARLTLQFLRQAGGTDDTAFLDRMILLGDPEHGDQILRAFSRGQKSNIRAVFSDTGRGGRSTLRGIRIYDSFDKLEEVITREDVTSLVFLPPFTSPSLIREVVDRLGAKKISIKWRIIPSFEDLTTGVLEAQSIRKVEIEDLLDRPSYTIDFSRLKKFVSGRSVMVTGAGGSIGSEICRQLVKLAPAKLVLFELNEYHLFEIERELSKLGGGTQLIPITGNVTSPEQIERAISLAEGIDIIYHAAAYKHVHLMEQNPGACFYNNVVGTDVLATIAEKCGVEEFVLVSTDKAVRPTSLMGASKRLAERVVIERPPSKTSFKAVRFGNVLGSSGSVVPIFQKQIAEGGPVTVTSHDITRYFMTIPEAVELVLAAGSLKDDRRILVLEMGKAVKIDQMARRMIELSGLIPDEDIEIVYSGLRKGEKEYEELLTDDENVVRTDSDRIWVVEKMRDSNVDKFEIAELIELINSGEETELRSYVHQMIEGSLLVR